MKQHDKRILVVGAGPVGLSLALALAKNGIGVDVFEKESELSDEMRASTFHAATMEKMDQWGVLDKVLAKGHKVSTLQFWDRREKKIVGNFDYHLIDRDTKFPFRLQCPQNIYAKTLAEHLNSEPLVKVHMGYEFVEMQNAADHVKACFATADGKRHTFAGALLCGADGANSAVRRNLNLGFEGMTYEDRFLLVGTNIDLNKYYPGIASVNYIFDPEEWVIVLKLNQMLRIVFKVGEDQDEQVELSDERIRQRVWGFIGEDLDFPIQHRSIYRVHQRVADTFHINRCLLLGDAAHINNPASGMGMNSGILDAACLSEKIVAFLDSHDQSELSEYSDLRRNYALEKIKNYTRERYADLSVKSEAERQKRNEKFMQISKDKASAREYLLKASMLDHRI